MFKKQKQDTTAQTTTKAPAEALPNIVVESFSPRESSCPSLNGHGVMLVPRQQQEKKSDGFYSYDLQFTTDDGRQVVLSYGSSEDPKKASSKVSLWAFIVAVEEHIVNHNLSLEDIPSFVFEYADIQYNYNCGPVISRPSFKKQILSRYKGAMKEAFGKTKTNEEREQLIAQVRGELEKFNAEFDEKNASVQRQTKQLFDEFESLFTENDKKEGGNDEQE